MRCGKSQKSHDNGHESHECNECRHKRVCFDAEYTECSIGLRCAFEQLTIKMLN